MAKRLLQKRGSLKLNSAKHIPRLKKGVERQNLLFFYEFTLMLADAAGVINEPESNSAG